MRTESGKTISQQKERKNYCIDNGVPSANDDKEDNHQ